MTTDATASASTAETGADSETLDSTGTTASTSDDSTSSSVTDTDATDTDATDTSGQTSDTIPDGPCAPNQYSHCTHPVDCEDEAWGWDCGDTSVFDANGCMRTPCRGDRDCGDDEACTTFTAPFGWGCFDTFTGECECGGDPQGEPTMELRLCAPA